MESLRSGEPVAGNPAAWLNLIHVDDAVAAVLACEQRGRPGQTYLISDGRPQTRGEYYERLARHIGVPPPQFAERASADGLGKRCDNRRMLAELGVSPRLFAP
jgi:nucleoside-diphosphate-sugar epimerase